MYAIQVVGLCLGLICPIWGQYYAQSGSNGNLQYQQPEQADYNRAPPPQILTHKQALNHDGNFKYLFTSENGLAQGETIAPDGSRNGGYSYVDPTGRKISVKYTAGKEGFRILEADHLPKAPLPVAPVPVAAAAPQPYAAPAQNYDDGQYRPQLYTKPRQYAPAPLVAQPSVSNGIREPEYNDEPGKPYSFGSGYAFEFAG